MSTSVMIPDVYPIIPIDKISKKVIIFFQWNKEYSLDLMYIRPKKVKI